MTMSPAQLDVLAVWIAHTHVFGAWSTTPYLRVGSPVPACGKTMLGELVAKVARDGETTVGVTPAALYRLIDQSQPTLILDEIDVTMRTSPEAVNALLAVINAGYRLGTTIPRVDVTR